MGALGKVKMQSLMMSNYKYPSWRIKHPCSSSSMSSFDFKRKLILPQLMFFSSPPSCALSVSAKIDEEQSDSAILPADLSESDQALVHVKFVLQKECMFGERFHLVGDDPQLGIWDPSNGITLDWSNEHVWSAQLDLPMGKKFEFKFVLVNLSGEVHWQPGPNRVLSLNQVIKNIDSQTKIITVLEDWDSASKQIISLEDELTAAAAEEFGVVPNEIEVHELIQGDVFDSGTFSRIEIDNSGSDDNNIISGGNSLVPGLNHERDVTQEDVKVENVENEGNQSSIQKMPVDGSEDESYNKREQVDENEDRSYNKGENQSSIQKMPEDDSEDGNHNNKEKVDENEDGSYNKSEHQSSIQKMPVDDGEDGSYNDKEKVDENEDMSYNKGENQSSIQKMPVDDGEDGSYNDKEKVDENEDRSSNEGEPAIPKSIPVEEVISQLTTAGILRNDLQQVQKALQELFPTTTAGILQKDLRWCQKALQELFPTIAGILQKDLRWCQKALQHFISIFNQA